MSRKIFEKNLLVEKSMEKQWLRFFELIQSFLPNYAEVAKVQKHFQVQIDEIGL